MAYQRRCDYSTGRTSEREAKGIDKTQDDVVERERNQGKKRRGIRDGFRVLSRLRAHDFFPIFLSLYWEATSAAAGSSPPLNRRRGGGIYIYKTGWGGF